MTGEQNLKKLLSSMRPELGDETYVFCTGLDSSRLSQSDVIMEFKEEEGSTYIIPLKDAERLKIPYQYPCRRITLKVHSSLNAVGFLAVITKALAENGISVNPVSAYYHDHLFVPEERANDALRIISSLAASSSGEACANR